VALARTTVLRTSRKSAPVETTERFETFTSTHATRSLGAERRKAAFLGEA
jgi:hypothetical protein